MGCGGTRGKNKLKGKVEEKKSKVLPRVRTAAPNIVVPGGTKNVVRRRKRTNIAHLRRICGHITQWRTVGTEPG